MDFSSEAPALATKNPSVGVLPVGAAQGGLLHLLLQAPEPCHPKAPEPCHPKAPEPCHPKAPEPCHPKVPEPCLPTVTPAPAQQKTKQK
ncbi:cornifin-B-like [Leptonychotes weddellii]|uniref:Cornifin-B-like n=1 Tax=Leptonychotes weddellii TaxID=9713 RepID=A0A7F8Q5G6_LEPWE|nr:cornifin-B-like [Leptonychotes weddellii]